MKGTMGKKRRNDAGDDEEEWGAGARALKAQTGGSKEDIGKREDKCRAHLKQLNKQFAEYVIPNNLPLIAPSILPYPRSPPPIIRLTLTIIYISDG